MSPPHSPPHERGTNAASLTVTIGAQLLLPDNACTKMPDTVFPPPPHCAIGCTLARRKLNGFLLLAP
eukprot:3749053-Pyramimonas_sp.AAC.2